MKPTTMILTIDPGNDTGWSLWANNALDSCGLGAPPDIGTEVWIESQVIYPHSKVPPNDILKLAHAAGAWAGRHGAAGRLVHFVEPAKWKGQTPKKVHNARVLAAMTPYERAIYEAAPCAAGKRHNILDAIGIGLWVAKRLGR